MTITYPSPTPHPSIHDRARRGVAQRHARLATWAQEHPRCPVWIAARIVAGLRRSALRRAAREAVAASRERSGGLDFRSNGSTSGRSLYWFRGIYLRASAWERDLMRTGYARADARRIAVALAADDRCTRAVLDPPPADVTDAEAQAVQASGDGHGWVQTRAAELTAMTGRHGATSRTITPDHVRRWVAWMARDRRPAQIGRRTARWYAIEDARVARERTAAYHVRMARMTDAARALAARVRTALDPAEEGWGWYCATGETIETAHSYTLDRCPDWVVRLAAVGVRVELGPQSRGRVGLSSAVERVSVLEAA